MLCLKKVHNIPGRLSTLSHWIVILPDLLRC